MQLTQLAEEYHHTADRLQIRLSDLRGQLLLARGEDALLLQRRIDTLYAELLDLRVVMTYLKRYYEAYSNLTND